MLKTLFVRLLLNVLVFITCIQPKADLVVLHVLLLPCRFTNFFLAAFPYFKWPPMRSRIFLSLLNAICCFINKHYGIQDWSVECANFFLRLLICLEEFSCMLTLAVCFSCCYFFHYFAKALFVQLSQPSPFFYSNYPHYIFFPEVFAS